MNVAAEHRSAEKAARALLNVNDEGTDWKSRAIIGLILMNGVAVLLESNDAWHTLYATEFRLFEYFSILVFTVEYVLRLWLAPEQERYRHLVPAEARLRYALTPTALVDLLAVAPFYLSLFIVIDLRYLRLFRLLRLMKLSHYFDGLQVFFLVLRREAAALTGALFTMTILVLVSACAMFSAEHAAQPEAFGTVIDAIWWAVVTLTTVGYGDITPATFIGKVLGMFIMLLGVGAMALPAGILAARFTEELSSRRELLNGHVLEAFRDGVIDEHERKSIQRLKAELGLSDEVVERIVRTQSLNWHRFCPNCGERVTKT